VERLGCAFKRGMKLPTIEAHVRFCVRDFGEENRELCYMVNSWMDAPSRELGMAHRRVRHDVLEAPILACTVYGDATKETDYSRDRSIYVDSIYYSPQRTADPSSHKDWFVHPTPKNLLIAKMVLQHLRLDGLVRLDQIRNWTWEAHKQKLKELSELQRADILAIPFGREKDEEETTCLNCGERFKRGQRAMRLLFIRGLSCRVGEYVTCSEACLKELIEKLYSF
jgi:hypothetical protein